MENMAVLKKIRFFKDLTAHELTHVNMITKRATARAGEEIVREGAPCDSLFIIKEGSVRVTAGGNYVATVEKEEPLGEVSFIDKGVRSATATALTDTVLIEIPAAEFELLLSREATLSSKFYRAVSEVLCARVREINDVMRLMLH